MNLRPAQADSVQIAARTSFRTRVLLALFGTRLHDEVLAPVIRKCYVRGSINERALSELTRDFDPQQAGAVGMTIGHREMPRSDHGLENR